MNRMSDSKVIYINQPMQEQILRNQEVMLTAIYKLMQNNSDRVIKDQGYRDTINELIDEYQHTRKILGKDYIER